MQESLGRENVGLDEMMAEVVALRGRCAHAHRPCCDTGKGGVDTGSPVPSAVPGEFVVRLGDGRGGSLHDLADGLAVCELGAGAAAAGLLSLFEFVEVEVRRSGDLIERLRLLRGAFMVAEVGGLTR